MYKYLGLIYIGNEGSYSDMKFTIKTGEAVITEAGHAANVIGDFPDKFQLISAEDCELILSNGTVTVNSPYPFYNQLEEFDPEGLAALPPLDDEEDDFDQDAIDADTAQALAEFDAEALAEYEASILDATEVDEDATEPDCETQ